MLARVTGRLREAPGDSAAPDEAAAAGDGTRAQGRQDATGAAGGRPDLARAGLAPDAAGLAAHGRASVGDSAGADPGQPEHGKLPGADASKPLPPEAGQLKALEAENAQARQEIAGLREGKDEQVARTERRPEQRADEQRWAAVEQRLQAVESDRDQLRQEVSELKADRDASEARHKAEIDSIKAEYEARISDLEAKAADGRQEQQNPVGGSPDSGEQLELSGSRDVARPDGHRDTQITGDDTSDNARLADVDDIDKSLTGGPDRDTQAISGRPIFSSDDVEFAKSAAAVLKSAGISLPAIDLILGGDSTRRALEKMPPEHQLKAIELAETFGILSGGMSPGAAVAALAASVIGPGMYAKAQNKARDVIRKIRNKDH